MDQEEAFLQAIRDDPENAALRLVYADWLEEQGDGRCEFLRLLHQRVGATARLCKLLPELDSAWVRSVTPQWTTDIQMIPEPPDFPRIETGAVQFGNDWPGLFIRGDNALHLAFSIRSLCERLEDHPDLVVADRLDRLKSFADLIYEKVRV